MQRLSISSNPSCSSAGPDDLESLGDVYVWGEFWSDGVSTESSGNQFSSKVDILIPKPMETDIVLDVHQISCGVRHISLVTRQGEVFTWGEELGGRLGHGNETDLSQPRIVDFLSVTNVDFVACGEYHTGAISTSGDLFTWGDGTHNAGLLGQGTDTSHWIPKRVSGPLDGLQVQSIACGVWHSAVITSTGKLFTFGDGKFGVLGHGDQESVFYPKEVQQLSRMKTIKVACGVWHTAAIVEIPNSSGPTTNMSPRKLFTWGDGDKYRLGHESKETYLLPTCVSALIDYNLHQIACGHTFTVVLTTSGHIFTMGCNAYGQLGNPNSEGKEPCLVKDKLVGEFVEEIACGANHVAVLTSRSEVFTWGKGANGQLGHGDTEDRKSPTLIEALKDRHVKSIACGSNFSSSICIHKWVSGSDQSVCSGCRQAFGFTKKRHNCYNCGLVHCHACSSRKALKAALAPTPNKPHRVCDACYNKLKSPGVGSGSNFSKKSTVARRSVDLTRERFDKDDIRSGRILPAPATEPVKYLEVKSQSPGAGSDSVSIIRASQVPIIQQMQDLIFPSSLSTLQNIKPSSTASPVQRLASPYNRRSGTPSPLTSRGAIDSLKKSNEVLSNEVAELQNQVSTLKQKCKAQNEENKYIMQHSREALTLASRCKVAKDVIMLVNTQLNEMAGKLPPDIYESDGFKAMKKQAESFLKGHKTKMYDPQLSYLEEVEYSNHSDSPGIKDIPQDSDHTLDETPELPIADTSDLAYIPVPNDKQPVNNSDSSRVRDIPLHSESALQDTIESSAIERREPAASQATDTRSSRTSTIKIEKAIEVIEQFEPGVYVTVFQLRNGAKFYKRVRFSKRKFEEKQAEEWWKCNKERVLKKYPPPQPAHLMKHSTPPEDLTPASPPPPPPPRE